MTLRKRLLLTIAIAVFVLLFSPLFARADDVEVTGIVLLTVSDINAVDITSSNATITWKTNGDSTSQVLYGTEANNYADQTAVIDKNPGISYHIVTLIGLRAGTAYHYQVRSTMDGDTSPTAVSTDFTFATEISGGGGDGNIGGNSSSDITVVTGDLVPTGKLTLNSDGKSENDIRLETSDHALIMGIPEGTKLLDEHDKPLATIYATKMLILPVSAPPGAVLLAYNFGPDGAKFDPPIILTLNYNPARIPAYSSENSLYIVFWNGSKWVQITSILNTAMHTISAKLSHFSLRADDRNSNSGNDFGTPAN